jgi:hypothetical protein
MEPSLWTVGFEELAAALAASPRGFALLTGVERGPAGIDAKTLGAIGLASDIGEAFSFCVDGKTYTAFEDPDDGYRSALGFMVARDGNWCDCAFEPCALFATFSDGEGDSRLLPPNDPDAARAFLMQLHDPSSMAIALQVGTSHADDWYPCFVAFHDPEVLERARALGIGLAFELDKGLAAGSRPTSSDPSASNPRRQAL